MIVIPDDSKGMPELQADDNLPPYEMPRRHLRRSRSTPHFLQPDLNELGDESLSHTSSRSQAQSSTLDLGASSETPPSHLQRSNFISISRLNSTLFGSYIIDPAICIPDSMLPALPKGESERQNLKLACRNGGMCADVWLVGGEPYVRDVGRRKKRAKIEVYGQNGGMKIRIRSVEGVPLLLTYTLRNGGGHITLPRSFRGPFKIRTSLGWVSFSSELASQVHAFGEDAGVRHCFIGEVGGWGHGTDGQHVWEGDELLVDVRNGRVKIGYVDELSETETQKEKEKCREGKKSGMSFAKMFGFAK